MDIIKAITLGIVQGISEFLPISSTAHLKIIPILLGWPDPGAKISAIIQLGTLIAVLVYFARDIGNTISGMIKAFSPGGNKNSPEARLGIAVIIGTIPVCILGLALKHYIEGVFRGMTVIAITQIVMAILLFVVERMTQSHSFAQEESASGKVGNASSKRPIESISLKDGAIVGIAQCLSLVPGASRSGSTLIGAFLTGLTREAAVRFSFLLSIPAVLISGLYELYKLKSEAPDPNVMQLSSMSLIIATLVAGLVGYASIAWLLKYLARHSTIVFVVYRILLGILLLGLIGGKYIAGN